MAIFTDHFLMERNDIYFPEDGCRCHPFNDRYWSEVESVSLERIKEIQLIRLKNIVKFAYEKSPFYKRLWESRKFHPDDIKHLDDIRKIPPVLKEDYQKDQQENSPFGTLWTTPPNEMPKFWRTSGTTANPRLFGSTWEDLENTVWQTSRALYAQGIRKGWRAFFAFGFSSFQAFWDIMETAQHMGCQVVPKGNLPTRPWLKLIKDLASYGNNFLCCTPTFAFRQAEELQEMGMDPRELNIKKLCVAGEPGYGIPETHKRMKDLWGAEIHDLPGSTETSGTVFFSCQELEKYDPPSDHVLADRYIVELLDEKTLEPVKGDTGLTCVTALGRFGFPIIRYFMKDVITIKEDFTCCCRRTLPVVIGGIKARVEDMIIVKGVNIIPSAVENIVRSMSILGTEFRIKKTKKGEVEILVESEQKLSSEKREEIEKILEQRFYDVWYVALGARVLDPGTIERRESKTKRVIVEE